MLGRYDDRDPRQQMQAAIDPPPEWVRRRARPGGSDAVADRVHRVPRTAAAIVVAPASA